MPLTRKCPNQWIHHYPPIKIGYIIHRITRTIIKYVSKSEKLSTRLLQYNLKFINPI